MGNQTNNPQHGSNDQKHSNPQRRDDDMSKHGSQTGKDQMGKDKQQGDQSGSRSGNDRNRQGSQDR